MSQHPGPDPHESLPPPPPPPPIAPVPMAPPVVLQGQPILEPTLMYARPVKDNLREIATRQRAVMFCILGYFVVVVLQFALPPELRLFLALGAAAVGITAAVFLFMLALSLYGTGTGIVLGILTLVPCVGLIVLLVINGKATGVLTQHGIKVGLMGADLSQIPEPRLPY